MDAQRATEPALPSDRLVQLAVRWTQSHEAAYHALLAEQAIDDARRRRRSLWGGACWWLGAILLWWPLHDEPFSTKAIGILGVVVLGSAAVIYQGIANSAGVNIERVRLLARLWVQRAATHDTHEMATRTQRTTPPDVWEDVDHADPFEAIDADLRDRGFNVSI
jgi:hypothetical protein